MRWPCSLSNGAQPESYGEQQTAIVSRLRQSSSCPLVSQRLQSFPRATALTMTL